MKIVIFGGTGFVGLNVAEALLARGHEVTLYDRASGAVRAAIACRLRSTAQSPAGGYHRRRRNIHALIAAGCDAVVLGAAVTAGDELERASPRASSRST